MIHAIQTPPANRRRFRSAAFRAHQSTGWPAMMKRRTLLIGGGAVAAGLGIRSALPQTSAGKSWRAFSNGDKVTVNGVVYEAECGENRVALQRSQNGVFRFSMIPGNLWENDDPDDSERTELDGWKGHIPTSQTIWASWSMYYEPSDRGAWSTADWCILRQIYAFYEKSQRPWSALVLKPGGVLHWLGGSATDPRGFWPTRYHQRIVQGQWLHFVETCKFDPDGGNGYWRSWLNGRQVLDYRGSVGKPGIKSVYAKFGIYRSRPTREIVSTRCANMRFTTDDLSALIEKPEPVPAWENWS